MYQLLTIGLFLLGKINSGFASSKLPSKFQAGIYRYGTLHGAGARYRTDLIITDATLLKDRADAYEILPAKGNRPLPKTLNDQIGVNQVSKIVFHDKFENVDPPIHNIAILILKVDYGEYTGLSLDYLGSLHDKPGYTLHLYGWNPSGIPTISKLSIASHKVCSQFSEFSLIDLESEFCCEAYRNIPANPSTKGSLLILPNPINPVLIGINPWPLAERIAHPPTVALKMSSYAQWIDDYIHITLNLV